MRSVIKQFMHKFENFKSKHVNLELWIPLATIWHVYIQIFNKIMDFDKYMMPYIYHYFL